MNFDFFATEFGTLFIVAFLSSFGHCYSMCGGFSLAFMAFNANSNQLFFLNCMYHIFRICAYLVLGLIFGLFGNILALNAQIQSFSLFILGIFMTVLGFALLFRGKILACIENLNFFTAYNMKIIRKAMQYKGVKSAVILGFANGFVPCGLVYFFLANAMSKDSLSESLFVMLLFGLSTVPAMLFFSQLAQMLHTLKKVFNTLSYCIIIGYGIYLSYMGLRTFV
ncbi:sulfite exporter TauE/SafE family protein [Campylobacter sp. MIT 21-1685]|uniref:sulfite exporter TauE/SafE family protein n=1 Tax=unclassified Campylobacter TaxID=2593542 RepID=UPI00224AA7CB|nr:MULTISPECIES: sulfite exporter TauE/SafE family protein [unclassified Campylobacter]MCX2683565.1 sulfite exporter TauE/SafE family protein [Campylobacter sp. MIT 21-1684]MCX2751840.1 sulfite exporter TauE/SafE family protein [Campylobacter sp. MIT 21-1682]MCX2808049.1 sulfite exporter TauE/SafE family protein [Campylobacter sp. MIT 21-1685]